MRFVYYETIKRELKRRPIYECRCDERPQTKVKEFTRLTYIGLFGGLEHLKIETSLIDEKFANTMGEYVYYESIKRNLKIKCIYECRCYERLQTKTKEFTLLAYTGYVTER